MGKTDCPDCGRRLVPMRKRTDDAHFGHVMAKMCINRKCVHFTDVGLMATWVNETGGPLPIIPPLPPSEADEPKWLYTTNRQT